MFLFVMLLMTSASYAQQADSEIFIQQSGQSLTLEINQVGQGNAIGSLSNTDPFVLNGVSQEIIINQLGSYNTMIGALYGDNIQGTFNFFGDSNLFEIKVNDGGLQSADSGIYWVDITGSNNIFEIVVGDTAVADNANFTWDIVGDYNTFTTTVNSDNYVSNLTFNGNYNNFTSIASGFAGHSVTIDHTGDYTNFNISQTSTLERNIISLQTTTSGTAFVPTTICIHQSDSGTTGC
jgi:hypothetical protein